MKLQSGAALLVLMLIIITGASFMLISKLNANLIYNENVEETYRSLERAKQALIGYALTVPERSTASPRPGPGYFPCPDIDNDGDSELVCGGGGLPALGRIPYETLEEDVLRDDSGHVFWYALSPNYRNIGARFTPLNSEAAGQLTLDGQGDVVAVIIAPGPAFNNQQRSIGPNAVINYLENDNSDGDINFISYVINDNGLSFNDRVIAITRQELMGAVEKRVLREVNITLDAYRNSFGAGNEAYPWLSPFTDPVNPPVPPGFIGLPGTSEGHLPVHIVGQGYNNQATYSVSWNNLTGGAYTPTGANPPIENCLRNTACNDPIIVVPAPDPVNLNNVSCIWVDPLTFNCTGDYSDHYCASYIPGICLLPTSQALTRTYTVTYTDDGSNITTNPDTALLPRTRNLDTGGIIALTGTLTIQAIDVLGDPGACGICPPAGELGRATLILNAGDTGDLALTGVDFYLDATGLNLNPGSGAGQDNDYSDAGEIAPEIPPWFVNNNWHHLVYLAYPASEPVPGVFNVAAPASGAGVCNANCLTLTANNGVNTVNTNVRALAVIAGTVLPTGVRPSNLIGDYFESVIDATLPLDGIDDDEIFDEQIFSNNFNDQVRTLLTTATP